jgi:hypothetical protein
MLDWLMNLFLVKWGLQQELGNNLCGYYICKHLIQYSLKTSEEYLEVHKQYTKFIYYYCVDIYAHTNNILILFSFIRSMNGGSKGSYELNRSKKSKSHLQDFLMIRS